jgi:hypothetical protein
MFWLIVLVVVGYLIIRSVIRAAYGTRSYGAPPPGPGYPPPGYAPGPGYFAGGGGGFWSGLPGGLGDRDADSKNGGGDSGGGW